MIAKSEFDSLLRSKDISLSYAFTRFGSNPPEYLQTEQFVNPADESLPATRMLNQNFFGDRLMLTLGPIVMSHDQNFFKKRKPYYKGRPGYFDIRSSQNVLTVEPHETLSVATNERIALSGAVGAYILPRLRNADSGLLYTPSYIDPFWDGTLQGVIVNATDHRQTLSLCDGLAICRFYPIKGIISEELKSRFPQKSHHYGQSWHKVLEEDGEPFPRRKTPVPMSHFDYLKGTIRDLAAMSWKVIVVAGYGTGIAVLVYKVGALSTQLQQLSSIPEIKQSVAALSNRVPRSGTVTIDIPNGKGSTSYSFPVKRSSDIPPTLWLQPATTRGSVIASITSRVEQSPIDSSLVTVTIDVVLKEPLRSTTVTVQWLLI